MLYWAQNGEALQVGAWWWFVPPGLCIALVGTSLALINFGIDEFVNPRLRTAGVGTREAAKALRRQPGTAAPGAAGSQPAGRQAAGTRAAGTRAAAAVPASRSVFTPVSRPQPGDGEGRPAEAGGRPPEGERPADD
jgi:hypothetical protein